MTEEINEFLEQTKILRQCSFIINPTKIKVGIGWTKKHGVKFKGNLPTRETIVNVLATIRPFIQPSERIYLEKIIKYATAIYGKSELFEFVLKSFKAVGVKYPAVTVNGLAYQSKDMLRLYIYGKYLHLDKNKKKIFKNIEQVFGPLAEVYALSEVDKYAGLIFLLAGHINGKLKGVIKL